MAEVDKQFTHSKPEMIGYDWHEGEEISHRGEGEFSTDFLTRTAVSRIQSHNSSASPLFLYVAFQAPHGPIKKPPASYLNMYEGPRYNWAMRLGAHNEVGTISVS